MNNDESREKPLSFRYLKSKPQPDQNQKTIKLMKVIHRKKEKRAKGKGVFRVFLIRVIISR